MILQADAINLPLPDKSVNLVLGSPPYLDARFYGDSQTHARKLHDWVDWMLTVTREAVRVSRGLVIWVCAGVTRDWQYQPGPEGLLYEWVKQGGVAWRPAYWRRVGIPGSGGKDWLRADVEYCLAFTADRGRIPWSDNTANGHPPKYAPGGEMSYRLADGERRNGYGFTSGTGRGRRQDGTPKKCPKWGQNGQMPETSQDDVQREKPYVEPVLANPGNLIRIKTGGGALGHKLAHMNEAPYPLDLAKWFIRGWCPPDGTVLDPFAGSGTTAHAAIQLGRNHLSCDLRMSQCLLTKQRLAQGVQREWHFTADGSDG